MKDKIKIKSPSKINLCLEVLGKSNKELHEIKSVTLNLHLADELSIERYDTFEIVSNIDLPMEENIIYYAYELFKKKYGNFGAKVNLVKNIPLDSGLGGGSSNAANFLKGICDLWGIELDSTWLYETGEKLGSDVNLFFTPGINLLTGTGSKSEKIDVSIDGAVLIFHNRDNIKNKTKLAYDLLTPDVYTDGKYSDQLIQQIMNRSLLLESIECYNVFENYINKLYPGILEIKENLEQQIGYDLHLSGSGPSLFCLINDKEEAKKIYNTVDSRMYGKLLTSPLEGK